MATLTTIQVLDGYKGARSALQSQMTKVSQQSFVHNLYNAAGGYNEAVNQLGDRNEEFYIAITQEYAVTTDVLPKLMDTFKGQPYLVVPDMLAQAKEISDYCVTQHRYLSTLNNLQNFTNNLETLWEKIFNCDDYLSRQREFEAHEWEI